MKLNLNLQFLTSPHHKSIILIRKSVISLKKKFPSLILFYFIFFTKMILVLISICFQLNAVKYPK